MRNVFVELQMLSMIDWPWCGSVGHDINIDVQWHLVPMYYQQIPGHWVASILGVCRCSMKHFIFVLDYIVIRPAH